MANVVELIIRGIDQTKQGLTTPIRNLDDLSKSLDRLKPAFAAAATAAAGAFVLMARSAINTADETAKAAQKVGLTAEALSTLRHAADLSGVSNESLNTSLVKLAKGLQDAALGTGDAKVAFDALGIAVTDSAGNLRSTDDVMADVARSFAGMEDGTTKTALAVKLFGRSGQELIPLLNAGADGIAAMRQEASDLGLEISGTTGKAAEEFNDNLSRLRAALMGVVNTVVAEFLPTFADLSRQAVTVIKDFGLVRGAATTLIDVFKVARFVVEAVATALKGLWQALKLVADLIGGLAATITTWFELIGNGIGGVGAAFVEMAKGNFSLGRGIISNTLGGLQTDFGRFQESFKVIGAQLITDWNKVTDTFGKGPLAPTIGGIDSPSAPSAAPREPSQSPDAQTRSPGPILVDPKKLEAEQKELDRALEAMNRKHEEATMDRLQILDLEFQRNMEFYSARVTDQEQLSDIFRKLDSSYTASYQEELNKRHEAELELDQARNQRLIELQAFQDEALAATMESQAQLDELGLAQFDAERLRLEMAFQEKLRWLGEHQLAEEEFHQYSEQAQAAHQAALTALEKRETAARQAIQRQNLSTVQGIFGNLAQAAQAFGKKGHDAYKAFATSEAIISTYLAANKAMAEVPYPLNFVAAAAVVAAGLANVIKINTSEPAGIAHGGLDFVPGEATYLLQRGERVLQPTANRALTEFLDQQRAIQPIFTNLMAAGVPDVLRESRVPSLQISTELSRQIIPSQDRLIQPARHQDILPSDGDRQSGAGLPINIQLTLDGRVLADWIGDASGDGRLQIQSVAIA